MANSSFNDCSTPILIWSSVQIGWLALSLIGLVLTVDRLRERLYISRVYTIAVYFMLVSDYMHGWVTGSRMSLNFARCYGNRAYVNLWIRTVHMTSFLDQVLFACRASGTMVVVAQGYAELSQKKWREMAVAPYYSALVYLCLIFSVVVGLTTDYAKHDGSPVFKGIPWAVFHSLMVTFGMTAITLLARTPVLAKRTSSETNMTPLGLAYLCVAKSAVAVVSCILAGNGVGVLEYVAQGLDTMENGMQTWIVLCAF